MTRMRIDRYTSPPPMYYCGYCHLWSIDEGGISCRWQRAFRCKLRTFLRGLSSRWVFDTSAFLP